MWHSIDKIVHMSNTAQVVIATAHVVKWKKAEVFYKVYASNTFHIFRIYTNNDHKASHAEI